jgi:hypothetical protein
MVRPDITTVKSYCHNLETAEAWKHKVRGLTMFAFSYRRVLLLLEPSTDRTGRAYPPPEPTRRLSCRKEGGGFGRRLRTSENLHIQGPRCWGGGVNFSRWPRRNVTSYAERNSAKGYPMGVKASPASPATTSELPTPSQAIFDMGCKNVAPPAP